MYNGPERRRELQLATVVHGFEVSLVVKPADALGSVAEGYVSGQLEVSVQVQARTGQDLGVCMYVWRRTGFGVVQGRRRITYLGTARQADFPDSFFPIA